MNESTSIKPSAHCSLCTLKPEAARDKSIIFLDIEGVMIGGDYVNISKDLVRLFGTLEEGQRYTQYQLRAAKACHLSKKANKRLMNLIKRVTQHFFCKI